MFAIRFRTYQGVASQDLVAQFRRVQSPGVSSAIRLIETTSNPGIPKPVPPTINSATNYCAEQLRVHDFCIFDHHRRREISAVIFPYRLEWAVLQLCRSSLICWADALCIIGFRSVQVEAIRTGSHFLAFRWYLRFSLSYRDVEELLAERGLHADHVTVWRWVQRYAPEMERRLHSRLRPTNDSWRVDETYIRVKGKWVYLYRAVDYTGATIDFLLSAKRDAAAAERFLAKALGGENHRRRGSSTPMSTPVIRLPSCGSKPRRLWRRIAGIDRCNI